MMPRPWLPGVFPTAVRLNARSSSQHVPWDLKQEDTSAQRKKPTPTYPNLPFQGGDDLPHHAHQVLIFVRVVREPHSLSDRQDLFADEPRTETQALRPELRGDGSESLEAKA